MSAVAQLFMKLSTAAAGEIKGDAQDKKYQGQIEIDDWSWALQMSDTQAGGGSVEAAVPTIFAFRKLMDRSSTSMLSAMRTGDPMKAVISLQESSGQQFRLTVTLTEVRVLSYGLEAKDQDKSGSVEESWEFDYRSIKFEYNADAESGAIPVTFTRPAGASTDKPKSTSGTIAEVRKLTRDMTDPALKDLWDTLQDDRKKAGSPGGDRNGE